MLSASAIGPRDWDSAPAYAVIEAGGLIVNADPIIRRRTVEQMTRAEAVKGP